MGDRLEVDGNLSPVPLKGFPGTKDEGNTGPAPVIRRWPSMYKRGKNLAIECALIRLYP